MIVPMKKVSLIIMGDKKSDTLRKLRSLGLVHIEISEASGEEIDKLREKIALLESAAYIIGKDKKAVSKKAELEKVMEIAHRVQNLDEEKKTLLAEKSTLSAELERLRSWGEIDPEALKALTKEGVEIELFEMPKAEYETLGSEVKTLKLDVLKSSVKFALIKDEKTEDIPASLLVYRLQLPAYSTEKTRERIKEINLRILEADKEIASYASYCDSIKEGVEKLTKELEFETYREGMACEELSEQSEKSASVAYFTGYIEAENIERLKENAAENAWGLLIEEPTPEDNVPTKLKNNKFVSLIYPLTDFLGTVPGYFEYDLSAWFLGFILIFFGIIFGDGGYGLLITTVAAIPIISNLIKKKPVAPAFLLVGLFGLSTILWGTLTCTWFGLAAESLPAWLQNLSVPLISNVYADKIWYPFWSDGTAGLTTAQNLQIFCFTLALVQLTVAHIKGALRNRTSLKMLGDIGSILQLLGIYYLVLSLVVNPQVFSFSLVISGVPVGTVSIALIGVGFLMSFVFANYEGSVIKAILSSLTNIVSVLLGVVNVFSDIVSYIRLWAVGLAGAAISATVNELASPLLGNFMFMILAIVLLVFGHGLNMVLNILSVIVHGIRLNTLEFSSHLDMSWSGHKFEPFKE